MHVTLIHLHDGYHDNSARYPLGLAYLAASLREAGHSSDIIDFKFFHHTEQAISEKLKAVKADVIGLSGLISAYHYLKDIVIQLRTYHPETPIVLGGPLGFTIENILLEHNELDAVCSSEGEDVIVEIAEAVREGRDFSGIAGLWLRDSQGKPYSTGLRTQIPDLDKVPFPAWDLIDPEIYRIDPLTGEPRPMSILASRGCPSSCDFCARVVLERSIRYRSVENVIAEISILRRKYNIRHFTFVDEYLTADMRWVKAMCQRLIDEKLDIVWNASSRVRVFDDETYDLLAASGCGCLSFGVESADPVILKGYGKRQKPEDTYKIFQKLTARGMRMNYLLITGAFQESRESMEATNRLLLANGNPGRYFLLTPLPGTPIYRQAIEKGLITDEDQYLTLLSTTDTTFVRKPTLKLTDMPEAEWLALKERCEQDTMAMRELRNRVGIFGQYLWRILAGTLGAQDLRPILPRLRTVWQTVLDQVEGIKQTYPELKIDVGYFKIIPPHHPDEALPLPPELLASTRALADQMDPLELLHWLWQRYGIMGEKLLAQLVALPEQVWQSQPDPQLLNLTRQVLFRDLGLMAHALERNRELMVLLDAQPDPVTTPAWLQDPVNWQSLYAHLRQQAALAR